ncbi:MAG: NAD(P)H-binding protein [Actinobacteria bacterium]|nr:NAD(P)H-binding protein [Actinomycetota bacterium]
MLVIGSTSFVGLPVIKKLSEKDYNVRCLVRTTSDVSEIKKFAGCKEGKIILNTGNLQSMDSILNNLKSIDALIYLVDLKNSYFVKNLLETLKKTGIKRVVFLSSTTVMVPLKNQIKDLKIESENLIRNSNLDYTILRSSMIYGSINDRNYSKMINFIKEKGFFVVFGRGNNLIQPVYLDDVANAIVEVIDNEKTFKKIYEITGKLPLRYNEMLQIMRKKMDKNFKIFRFPIKLSKFIVAIYSRIFKTTSLTPGMIERMEVDKAYDYSAATLDFGFKPLDFEEGIEKLINELKTISELKI